MGMTRRILAMAGFVTVLALALTLLYRVYLHHTRTEPHDDEGGPAIVSMEPAGLDAQILRTSSAK